MRFIVLFTFVISVNINAQFKVKLKKVENIFIELNENQSLNVGRPITFKAFARLKNGKVKDITYHSGFSVSGNGIEKKSNGRILILPNNNCDKEEYSMVAILSDNEYTFKDSLSFQLNYKGSLLCDFSGEKGKDGVDGDKVGFVGGMIRDRDGRDGSHGSDGSDGGSGPYLKAFIRPDTLSNLVLVDIFNLDNNQMYCYKVLSVAKGITINVNGGKGGHGGDGRRGQDGRDEVAKNNGKVKRSGDGGDGGRGGNAGNGGIGGVVELYVHRSLKDNISSISINNNGGTKGDVGKGGNGGEAGENLDGSMTRLNGVNGDRGAPGVSGMKGETKPIQFVDDLHFKLF